MDNDCSVLEIMIMINGIYDILCSIGILFLSNKIGFRYISRLHITIFKDTCIQNNPIVRRLLAYWIITYGFVRISVLIRNTTVDFLISSTYLIESSAYLYEDLIYKTTFSDKAIWVSYSSLVLGILIFFRSWKLN